MSKEVRSSKEYIDAYVEYVKKGYDIDKMGAEKRELLMSENVESGTIAVPTYVEERIRTAWEDDEIMRRIRRTFVPGNLKVGVEVSASDAVIHTEGDEAITSEDLVISFVDLIPEYIKKMVHVTHTALALTGTAFLDYLYDEIEHKIVAFAGDLAVDAMKVSPLVHQYSIEGAAITAEDIITAAGNLSGAARNIALIISRSDAAALKVAALSAGYPYDPFDGMTVIYREVGDGEFIIADLDAVQANFPEGGQPKFIFDELTLAAENVVRIIGRLLMAVDVVSAGKVVYGSMSGE